MGQQSKSEDAKLRKVLRKKGRLEKAFYVDLKENPMDNGESLKVFEHGNDIMKVVFWDKSKGKSIGIWSLPALETLWGAGTK